MLKRSKKCNYKPYKVWNSQIQKRSPCVQVATECSFNSCGSKLHSGASSTSQGSPHLQTQIQADPVLSSLYPSLISFSYFTFPGAPYRIFPLFLPWLPCHIYLVVIEHKHPAAGRFLIFSFIVSIQDMPRNYMYNMLLNNIIYSIQRRNIVSVYNIEDYRACTSNLIVLS